MKFNFEKASLFSAVLAMVAASFIACGPQEESSIVPPPPEPVSSSSEAPIVSMSSVAEKSPIRFTTFSTFANGDWSEILFQGSATLDDWDSIAVEGATDDQTSFFTRAELKLVHIVDGLSRESQLYLLPDRMDFTDNSVTIVNLSEIGAKIVDHNKLECGAYRAYITVYATNDPTLPEKFSARDSVDFIREEIYCAEAPEPVSSSSAPGFNVELVEDSITLTAKGMGFNFTTWQAVPNEQADIYLELVPVEESLTLHVGNGTTKIGEYINANDKNENDDWDYDVRNPRDSLPIYMSDFRFIQSRLGTEITDFQGSRYYVALTSNYNEQTGDGFYAFTLAQRSTVDKSNNITIKIQVFKKK